MESFIRQVNRIGVQIGEDPVDLADLVDMPRGPSAEDVEAAQEMSDAERSEFIQSMVDRLAERLKDEPDDLDGWLQLARAYMVLGDNEKARGAFEAANGLLDDLSASDPRRGVVAQGLQASGG